MVSQKALIGNELMKELITIRVDTVWKMLGRMRNDAFPDVYEEGATGKWDNKGAIFIPGGLIYQDVDEMAIQYTRIGAMQPKTFRKKIRTAMQFDNATLLYPDGIASGINLDSGFFSRTAKRICTFKRAAFRRKTKIGAYHNLRVTPEDIIRSHCPSYMNTPYGARTRISNCAAVGLIDPPLYFAYCESELNLSRGEAKSFARQLDISQEPAKTNGTILFPPYIVVCHDTRYKENSITGLIRILGIGKFGEFATLSFERINPSLLNEIKRKKQPFTEEDIFATYGDISVLGILRIYAATNPGRRSKQYTMQIVSPRKLLNLDLEQLGRDARKRYHLD